VGPVRTGCVAQDEPPQCLKFFGSAAWAEQHAAIRQFLRLSKRHGDGEGIQVPKTQDEMLQVRQFIMPAERDVRGNQGVLYWVKPLPDRFDKRSLRLWQKEAELAPCEPRWCSL